MRKLIWAAFLIQFCSSTPMALPLESRGAPAASCAGLARLQLTNTTITLAEEVGGGSVSVVTPPGAQARTITNLPPFCRVAGTIKPTSDSNILFEVWLPLANWNGKFAGVGNGGWAGTIAYGNSARSIGPSWTMADAMRRGYAAASTDTGHPAGQGLDQAKFAFGHPEVLIDYAYRSEHEMTEKAKAVVRAFYGKPAKLSYWLGCSTGGKQGLMEAQRYPRDYDGIVAGAPANNWTRLMSGMLDAIIAAGKNPLNEISQSQLDLVNKAVVAACDAGDGLVDGVLNDPRTCKLDPTDLVCHPGQEPAACLTSEQLRTFQRVYDGLRDPGSGRQLFPGLAHGGETGWRGLTNKRNPPAIAISHYRWLVFQDPNWDWTTFDFAGEKGMQAFRINDEKFAPILNATNPDLRAFMRRGGKLIQYHGWSDSLAPQNSIDYFESVVEFMNRKKDRTKALADVGRFYRLFMIPGMNHCGGGPGTDTWDSITALENWVEHGQAPDRILAQHLTNGVADRSRPLCAYPAVSVYAGNGDPNAAANFICREPKDTNKSQ